MSEHRFSFAAKTYDRHARPQQALAATILAKLPDVEPDRILELGVGTGQLTRQLVQRYPRAEINAIDIAPGMVEFGRRAWGQGPRVIWTTGDAQSYRAPEPYPLIVSGSALQWVRELRATFDNVRGNLEAGGSFVFGMMLNGTLQELRQARREIAPSKMSTFELPTLVQTLDALTDAGFTIRDCLHETYRYPYQDTRSLLKILHEQGVTGGSPAAGYAPLTRGELDRLIELYQKRSEEQGRVYADYETVVVVAE